MDRGYDGWGRRRADRDRVGVIVAAIRPRLLNRTWQAGWVMYGMSVRRVRRQIAQLLRNTIDHGQSIKQLAVPRRWFFLQPRIPIRMAPAGYWDNAHEQVSPRRKLPLRQISESAEIMCLGKIDPRDNQQSLYAFLRGLLAMICGNAGPNDYCSGRGTVVRDMGRLDRAIRRGAASVAMARTRRAMTPLGTESDSPIVPRRLTGDSAMSCSGRSGSRRCDVVLMPQ